MKKIIGITITVLVADCVLIVLFIDDMNMESKCNNKIMTLHNLFAKVVFYR